MTEDQTVLARGLAALLKITNVDPESITIEGPFPWSYDEGDDRYCWEIRESREGTSGLVRVVRPEESREDAEQWIADLKTAAILLDGGEHG